MKKPETLAFNRLRRHFIKQAGQGLLAGGVLAACGGGGGAGGSNGGAAPAVAQSPFFTPPLLDPAADPVTGVRLFNLNLQAGSKAFTGQGLTSTWGINGAYLGPTLRMSRNDAVELAVTNGIGRNTTMHWHGMHVPSDMDGGPHQLIAPNTTWRARFTVNQRAATCWYHPHPDGNTGEQVYHGLAGMILVDDAESRALPLPATYGVDDFPVVIQDRALDANGVFSYLPLSRQEIMRGKTGNSILINGVLNALLHAPAGKVRFRLLNGSNARVYSVGFSGGLGFQLVATDQGLLDAPVSLTSIDLSPGERAEIVVDFAPVAGGTVVCSDLRSGLTLFSITADQPAGAGSVPAVLSATQNLPTAAPAGAQVRTFSLGINNGVFTINGQSMNMNVINIPNIPVNTVEEWTVINTMNMDHNFHVHGTAFSILSRNGAAPPAHEKGWKDTVWLPAGASVRLWVKFTQPTVAGAPLMYHCHVLEHEDNGMMGQFTVV